MSFITLERFRKTPKKINMIHIPAEMVALVLYVLYVLFCHFFKGVAPQTNYVIKKRSWREKPSGSALISGNLCCRFEFYSSSPVKQLNPSFCI